MHQPFIHEDSILGSEAARRLYHLSGKGAALPPLPPLRTGRESFPSSGSSRYKAPRERSRFHDGLNPGFMAMDAKPLPERTFREI
jgi:hypothetical protein